MTRHPIRSSSLLLNAGRYESLKRLARLVYFRPRKLRVVVQYLEEGAMKQEDSRELIVAKMAVRATSRAH